MSGYPLQFVAFMSLVFFVVSPTFAQPTYIITDLGTLPGGSYTIGYSVSNSGEVAGKADGTGFQAHAFLYSAGAMTDLGTLPGTSLSNGTGVNSSGDVVGIATNGGIAQTRAFLYHSGAITDLGTLPGGSYADAYGINDSGQVTGSSSGTGFQLYHAFLYTPKESMTDLGTLPGGVNSVGIGINEFGQVTGRSDGSGFSQHAFLYSSGTMKDLGVLPDGTNSVGTSVNKYGQVTGYADGAVYAQYHAFLFASGTMTDLGTLPGDTVSQDFGINDSGQVVGISGGHAFLYSSGKMRDLNTLLPSGSGWVIEAAFAINKAGQITGVGRSPAGPGHAYLLTPAASYRATVQKPINTDGSTVFNVARGVVPVKFKLFLNRVVTCNLPPATISVSRIELGVQTTTNTYTTIAADSNFRISDCQYIYNLPSAALGTGVYRVGILIEGIEVGNGVFALN